MNKQKWIARALELGAEGLEIYEGQSAERSVAWFDGQMDSFVTSDVKGTSLRAIVDGKAATVVLESVDDGKIDETVGLLIEQAKLVSSKDADILREPETTEEVKSRAEWVRPSMAEIREKLAAVEAAVKAADPRVKQVTEIGWNESENSREITNSKGVRVADSGRVQILYAGVAVEENGEVKDGYRVEVVPDLSKLDPAEVAGKAVRDALDDLGGKPVPSGQYPVIFERRAMTSIFGALTDMFSGDLIGKGLSPLKDKADAAIFSDKITVVDDPKNLDCLDVANYDDEGCPTRRKILVDRGVFRQALHNTKSAARMGVESTGNGFRHGYAGAVSVSPKNCSIEPGADSFDELLKKMGDGLVITHLAGLHAGLNHVTTDFSLQCSGYLVKNGKRERPVALVTVAGNFLDLMKKVTAVGSDLDWEYRSIACPSILFESCAVAGE
ncbi:MAG: TldD/PmbA family protein [Ruminococcaceae bacterium]|jgi:PmbA protein|nr:TldD/PmbA family protein [Oscillospiraceae bacterium]